MESDPILSFSTPLPIGELVEAAAAPVLELAYAHYYLLTLPERREDTTASWVTELGRSDTGLLEALREFWLDHSAKHSGYDLFVLAAELGYARDDGTERFLNDFPDLPNRLMQRFEAASEEHYDGTTKAERMAFWARLERLREGERAATLARLLARLWTHLAPHWQREGRGLVDEAARAFRQEYQASGDVLKALPTHHFTQFELSAAHIRTAQERGSILVTPLYFASGGGFSLELGQRHFIGYGLRTESVFEDTNARVADLAGRFKAFADPTRLMLLGIIARWHRVPLTVGDLALQLGVSQPTVSGHLKVLREAGFVTVEKRGNRSFHRADADTIRRALSEMEGTLLSFAAEQ